jgi:hypothetical protein
VHAYVCACVRVCVCARVAWRGACRVLLQWNVNHVYRGIAGKSIARLRDKLLELAFSLPFIPDSIPSSHVRLQLKIEKQSRFKPFLSLDVLSPLCTRHTPDTHTRKGSLATGHW